MVTSFFSFFSPNFSKSNIKRRAPYGKVRIELKKPPAPALFIYLLDTIVIYFDHMSEEILI